MTRIAGAGLSIAALQGSRIRQSGQKINGRIHVLNAFRWASAAALLAATTLGRVDAAEIAIQTNQPVLQFRDAAPGGAHPLGGQVKAFVDHANAVLGPLGFSFTLHASGNINPADRATVKPALVAIKDFSAIHAAVARGAAAGGLNAAAGIPADSNMTFGELMSGGAPFGLEADELMSFVYAGGGLELLQSFYDKKFDNGVKVIPIGITGAPGAGFFKEPLPDPDTDPSLTPETAMAALCRRPMIVRWSDTASAVWAEACKRVGVEAASFGAATRCKDSTKLCDPARNPDNPVVNTPKGLTFGGFVPGVIPQTMAANGNIDAYELNLPTEDIQFLKLSQGLQNKSDAEVDLKGVAPPYSYGGAWHQPAVFVELLINKAYWNALPERDRRLIEATARSSLLSNFAIRNNLQAAAMKELARHGVVQLRWPRGLIDQLRAAMPAAMAQEAARYAATGDDSFGRLYKAVSEYQAGLAVYADFGDINQGAANIPTSPPKR